MTARPSRRGRGNNKFGAIRTVVDGVTFDSKSEARRWQELQLLERAGEIQNLSRQVPYDLRAWATKGAKGDVVGRIVIDFEYYDVRAAAWIVEDRKGCVTPLWRWKAKHFKAQYGRTILETR